jgi:dTDP-4-dehydrorhamnose reductase
MSGTPSATSKVNKIPMSKEKPKALVIGAGGFLGRYFVRSAAGEFKVVEGSRAGSDLSGGVAIDITDKESVASAFRAVRPDVVLLLAAHSDIDYCEQHPQEAWAVNLRGAEHVTEACARAGALLVFTSTGAVFDGRQPTYNEESPVSPVSVYGETKAEAEKLIIARLPDALIVRLALVIGFAMPPGDNAVLDKLKKRWLRGDSVAFPVFERRNPIDAATCSRFLLELAKRGERGIFHIGSSDLVSRYDLGLKLAVKMGFPGQVQPQTEPVPGRAPRGTDHFLLTDKLRAACAIPIPTTDDAIERCFDGLA